MHMQGTPQTMQVDPRYSDLLTEIDGEMSGQISALEKAGFHQIILDPGFGFGKTLSQNYTLLHHLEVFKSKGFPLLAGLSRKSMINQVIHSNPVTALNGTTVLNTIALLNGANILRVHDVKEAMEAIALVDFYQKNAAQ
jgi:dihydropteroate synthase